MSLETLVDVSGLIKRYGSLIALNGPSFQVRSGEIVGLLGANGAGKSTLMKLLTCYLTADEGTAKVAGHSIDTDPVEVRRHIGYLPENAPLYTEMRVKDFLSFVARMRHLSGAKAKERIDWAVESCGLKSKYMAGIGTLSRGFRQRVGIAQAILHDPDLLILDEPTSGLDPLQIIEIRRLIMELGKTKTVFFSTHIMQEVEAVCTRALLIHRGKLLMDGPPNEFKRKGAEAGRITARLRNAPVAEVREALKSLAGAKSVGVEELPDLGVLECTLLAEGAADSPKVVNEIGERFLGLAREKNWVVVELHTEGVSLEDAFLHFTGLQLRHGVAEAEPAAAKE